MKNRVAILWVIFIAIIILLTPAASAEDIIIQLEDGKKIVLHDDYTWEYLDSSENEFDFSQIRDNVIPSFLRQGIAVKSRTIRTAVEMYLQGWRYAMPVPKSRQAAWGNFDRRTTWYYGYWFNIKTEECSKETPVRKENGNYHGDYQDLRGYWRNGGSPRWPTKIEWLLSDGGGVKPVE
jgi:hypothetical protein